MTLLELVAALRRRLDDWGGGADVWEDDDSECLWSNVELTRYLNEAQREYCRRRPIRDDSTPAVTEVSYIAAAGRAAVSPKVLRVLDARIDGQPTPIVKRLASELTEEDPDWRAWPAEPEPSYYCDDLVDGYIVLAPQPVEDKTVLLVVDRLPLTAMSWETRELDAPEIWVDDHEHLMYWAAFLAYLKPDAETLNQTKAASEAAIFETMIGPRISTRQWDIVRRDAGRHSRTRVYYR